MGLKPCYGLTLGLPWVLSVSQIRIESSEIPSQIRDLKVCDLVRNGVYDLSLLGKSSGSKGQWLNGSAWSGLSQTFLELVLLPGLP